MPEYLAPGVYLEESLGNNTRALFEGCVGSAISILLSTRRTNLIYCLHNK